MNVLSLFDGMSCGMIALDRLGIPVENYYASEVDKYAIQVSKANWPNIIHVGDVTKLKIPKSHHIDLLIGGSPCQGFSFAGKQLNFDDPRSKLFFEFVRLLKEIRVYNPDVLFLLENVVMKKEYQNVITEHLGVEPVLINSALVSAQNRKRLYWTNIPNISQPADRGLIIRDILEDHILFSNTSLAINTNQFGNVMGENGKCMQVGMASDINGHDKLRRVYHTDGKAPTLTANSGGNQETKITGCALRGRVEDGKIIQKFEDNKTEK